MGGAMAAPMLLAAYRGAWRAAWPLVAVLVKRRDRIRGVPPSVAAERFGWSKRPAEWPTRGVTLWFHGASVGECLSVLPLVELALAGRLGSPDARVLVTTTTPAARKLLADRLERIHDQRAACVFAPLDHPAAVDRFLTTWKPYAGIWVESELWPTLLSEAHARGVHVGIVNARMSLRSVQMWRLPVARSVGRQVASLFSLVLCQDEPNRQRFMQLGASRAECATNLKFVGAPPTSTTSSEEVAALKLSFGDRRVWIAASTHDGEEELAVTAHIHLARKLAASSHELLTVIIPRHPERTPAIVAQLTSQYPELQVARRSESSVPAPTTDVFIVDTLGETLTFFSAAKTVVMGGTFTNRGGHNPLEPLRAGCRVIVGPHMHNFADITRQLQQTGLGLDEVATADVSALAHALSKHLEAVNTPDKDGNADAKALELLASSSLAIYERRLCQWLAERGNASER